MRKLSNTLDNNPSYLHIFRANYLSKFIRKDIPKILDIGCWSGQFHRALDMKHQYFGVDIDEDVVKFASKKFKNTEFKTGSASSIPYNNNFFDVVVFSEVIEHIPANTETKALKEINRVMKKNGILFLSTPLDTWVSKMLDPAYWLIGHRHYKISKLVKMLNKTGFKIVETKKAGVAWHSFAHLIELFCKHSKIPLPKRLVGYLQYKSENYLKSGKEGYLTAMVIAKKHE